MLDINTTVSKLGEKCKGILAVHALSGCDAVSYCSGKGKVSAIKVLTQADLSELDSVLGEENATESDLIKHGTSFFCALYGQKKGTSMNTARYEIFCRRKNPPPLKSLPPTDSNLAFHIQRAHLQMKLWKAADKAAPPSVQITDHGWEVHGDGQVMPAMCKKPIAPGNLMDVISCSCQAEGKACSRKCSCAASSLSCTSYCMCEGGAQCFNLLTQEENEQRYEEDVEIDTEQSVNDYEDGI